MINVAVIGIGSPFGADQIAELVINDLNKKLVENNLACKLHLNYCDRPGLYLLELLRGMDKVFLIDAVVADGEVGDIYRFTNDDTLAPNTFNWSTHALKLPEVLQLGKILNLLPDQLVVFGIEIGTDLHLPLHDCKLEIARKLLVEKLITALHAG